MFVFLKRSLVFFIYIFAVTLVNSAHAQTATCADFSINPNPVLQNQNATLIYSKGLRENEWITATIRGTTKRIAHNCEDDPTFCGPNFTTIGSFSTSDLNIGNSYSVDIIYTPASGITNQLSCSTNFSYTNSTQQFCTNRGLTGVTPSSGFQSSQFIFSGCIGDGGDINNPCSGRYSRVSIKNGTLEVASSSINDDGINVCNADGTFSIYVTNLPTGRLTAQLTQNQNIVGNIVTFNVESGSRNEIGELCTTNRSCAGTENQPGTQSCTGTYQNQNNNIVCVTTTCSSCSYCGDDICSTNEIGNCSIDCNQQTQTPSPVAFEIIPCTTVNITEWNKRNDPTDLPPMDGIQTAIGCLPTNPAGIVKSLISLAVGIAGAIAFLLILYGAIKMIISRADPKGLQESKEIITAAIVGLLLIILSVVLLKIIGYDILAIPGFG